MMTIIDAHSHLWLKQDTSWNGKVIRSMKNGRSMFLGEALGRKSPGPGEDWVLEHL